MAATYIFWYREARTLRLARGGAVWESGLRTTHRTLGGALGGGCLDAPYLRPQRLLTLNPRPSIDSTLHTASTSMIPHDLLVVRTQHLPDDAFYSCAVLKYQHPPQRGQDPPSGARRADREVRDRSPHGLPSERSPHRLQTHSPQRGAMGLESRGGESRGGGQGDERSPVVRPTYTLNPRPQTLNLKP